MAGMQSQNRIFDDIARVAGGALGALSSLKDEVEAMIRDRMERFMADGDFVRREEFDVVRAMAAEARAEQERLAARVAELEAALKKKP
jgi:BMFP domain-containing protein YqiC